MHAVLIDCASHNAGLPGYIVRLMLEMINATKNITSSNHTILRQGLPTPEKSKAQA